MQFLALWASAKRVMDTPTTTGTYTGVLGAIKLGKDTAVPTDLAYLQPIERIQHHRPYIDQIADRFAGVTRHNVTNHSVVENLLAEVKDENHLAYLMDPRVWSEYSWILFAYTVSGVLCAKPKGMQCRMFMKAMRMIGKPVLALHFGANMASLVLLVQQRRNEDKWLGKTSMMSCLQSTSNINIRNMFFRVKAELERKAQHDKLSNEIERARYGKQMLGWHKTMHLCSLEFGNLAEYAMVGPLRNRYAWMIEVGPTWVHHLIS